MDYPLLVSMFEGLENLQEKAPGFWPAQVGGGYQGVVIALGKEGARLVD